MIDVAGRESQFRDHLWPVYRALPPAARGHWHGANLARTPLTAGVTLVASWGDLKRVQGRAIYMEHGVGTPYGTHPSFPGGEGKQGVELFLTPNQHSYDLNRDAYPEAQHRLVGTPKLDEWAGWEHRRNDPPVVAVAFADRNNGVPEGRTAHPYYAKAIRALLGRLPVRWIGHGHPRTWQKWARYWSAIGVEPVRDFREVLQRADLYVVDASSTAYEFAYTGRPVVTLNAPWYRRDVEHGTRFWKHIPGVQVDDPRDLRAAIIDAFDGKGETERQAAIEAVYPIRDGTATARAVEAIMEAI